MKTPAINLTRARSRRSFISAGLGAGATAASAVLLAQGPALSAGDAAILRFLSAAEILETDLWIQYNELGGIQDNEVPGGTGSPRYTKALEQLDADMPQYIHDNTEDEMTHFTFLNAYLSAKGASPVNLDQFRILPGSRATGAQQIGRLTNLMQLSVDTSWWTRYRSGANNPDLDPGVVFPQAVPSLSVGQHPAIPRSDDDLTPKNHIQAIANTAAFHFCSIEQGGTSIYPSLAQRVSSVEVLRILLSIGPTETAHFQTWHDKAGNAPPLTDPKDPSLVFPNLNEAPLGGEEFSTNLIMPEPCRFLSLTLPPCSIIRPTATAGAAMGVVKFLTASGLFLGQSPAFFEALQELATAADAATR